MADSQAEQTNNSAKQQSTGTLISRKKAKLINYCNLLIRINKWGR